MTFTVPVATTTTRPVPCRNQDRVHVDATQAGGSEAPDLDGDGCSDSILIGDGTITAAGTTFDIGVPGDHIAVADWNCDGTATPGLTRPRTGDVFLFETWPSSISVTITPSATVKGAIGLDAPRLGAKGACTVEVRTSNGPSISLTTAKAHQ